MKGKNEYMNEKRNENKVENKNEIIMFLCITGVLSIIFESLFIITDQTLYVALLMFTPAFAAGVTKYRYFRKEKNALYFRKCKSKYLLLAFLMPIIYIGIPYCIYWCIRPESMNMNWNFKLICDLLIGIGTNMILTLGEEIGWRGFLVPHLTEWIGMKKAFMISGLIWGGWHVPLLVSGFYLPGVSIWYKIPMFMIVITGVGVIIGIITIKSKSIWPAVVLHAVHNTMDQNIFGEGTVGHCKVYFVSEAGICTAFIVIAIVIWILIKLKKDTVCS